MILHLAACPISGGQYNLFACSACNSNAKRDRFAVIDDGDALYDVTRPKNAPVVPPVAGRPALINPRFEDPLQYLRIDMLRTFDFLPRQGLSGHDEVRAKYTIDVLKLNGRDELRQWRKDAYSSYIGWVDTYRRYRDEGDIQRISEHVITLKGRTHLAVWEEMKRVYRERDVKRWGDLKGKYNTIRELDTLFTITPEVLAIEI